MDFDPGRFVNQSSAYNLSKPNGSAKLASALDRQRAQLQADAAKRQAINSKLAAQLAEQAKFASKGLTYQPTVVRAPYDPVLEAASTPQTAYVDPMVDNVNVPPAISVQQPQQQARMAGRAPGILSAPTATQRATFERGALQHNPGMFSLIGPVDKIDKQASTYGKVGGFAGGVLGGLVGGPVGGLLGAFAGKAMGKNVGQNGGFGKGSTGSGGKGSSGGRGAESSGRSNGSGSRAGERSGWAGR